MLDLFSYSFLVYHEEDDNAATAPSYTSKISLPFAKKKQEYLDTFTVHGLTRACSYGKSKFEWLLWALIVIGAIMTSTWLTYSNLTHYLEYKTYSEMTTPIQEENPFPSLTICELRSMLSHYFSYCNKKHGQRHDDYSKPCTEPIREPLSKVDVLREKENTWGSGIFTVNSCFTWGGKTCTSDAYIKSLRRFDHSCITLNYAGNLSDSYNAHAYIELEYNNTIGVRNPYLIAIVHDPKIVEFEMTNRFVLEKNKTYEMNIQKTVIKRLPPPFPSQCTYEKINDIFPGKYTRRNCLESNIYLETYRICGDIVDYFKKYIPREYIEKYKKNKTIHEVLECMKRQSHEVKDTDCPVPCEEIEYTTRLYSYATPQNAKDHEERYRVHMQYSNVDSYQLIEEKQLVPLSRVVGNVGGLIGLILGASIISVIEIVIYLALSLAQNHLK